MSFGIILLLSYIAQTVFNICICYSRYDNFEELKYKMAHTHWLAWVPILGLIIQLIYGVYRIWTVLKRFWIRLMKD
jgi:hypothetical protein